MPAASDRESVAFLVYSWDAEHGPADRMRADYLELAGAILAELGLTGRAGRAARRRRRRRSARLPRVTWRSAPRPRRDA